MALYACLILSLFAPDDLEELHKQRAIGWTSDATTGREEITAGNLKIVFTPGLSTVLINGMPRTLTEPPRLVNGRHRLPAELVAEILKAAPVRKPEPIVKKEKPKPKRTFPAFSIVIDPGHGGKHTGGKGRTGLLEKNVVLDVSLRLQKILEEGGVKVTMTRTTDKHHSDEVYADLQHRCDISNRVKPDIFMSIHANWVANPNPRGYEVWVPAKARGWRDRSSRSLAKFVRTELGRTIGSKDRGTKDEKNMYVLRKTTATAVLVEMEFISNANAERQLGSGGFRQKLAESLAEALKKYIKSKK